MAVYDLARTTVGANGPVIRDARAAHPYEIRRSGRPRATATLHYAAAPVDVAELLGVDTAAKTLMLEHLVYAPAGPAYTGAGRLIELARTWIPEPIAAAAGLEDEAELGADVILRRMASAGIVQTEVIEHVRQQPATAAQAAALGVDEGELLLTISRAAYTAEGRHPVEVTRHTLGRGWTLQYTVPLP